MRYCFNCRRDYDSNGPYCPDCIRNGQLLEAQKKVADSMKSVASNMPSNSSNQMEWLYPLDPEPVINSGELNSLRDFVNERVTTYDGLFLKLRGPLKNLDEVNKKLRVDLDLVKNENDKLRAELLEMRNATAKAFGDRDNALRLLNSEIQNLKKRA